MGQGRVVCCAGRRTAGDLQYPAGLQFQFF